MKKLRLIAAIFLLFGACAKKESFVIFSTARANGQIYASNDCKGKQKSCGGFPALKNIYNEETLPKLIVDLGNWASDSPTGKLTKGMSVIEMLNAFPYTAAVPGISDITLIAKDFNKLADSTTIPLIATNMYKRSGGRREGIKTYHIEHVYGHGIGFIGILLPNPSKPNKQRNYANFRIEKASYDANIAINALKQNRADIIVALISVAQNAKPDISYYRKLVAQASRINLIITDDPEVKKVFKVGKTWVIPSGHSNKTVEKTKISFNISTGKVHSVNSQTIAIDPVKYKEDADLQAIAEKYKLAENKYFGKKIGTLKSVLPLKNENTYPLANFTADCIKRWARVNASIVPISEPAAAFSTDTIRLADLYKSFPNNSNIVFVKIRGENLIESLRSLPVNSYTVSGLNLFISKDNVLKKIQNDFEPLNDDKIYHIAVPDSMVSSNNASLLANASEFANSKKPTRDVIRWCIGNGYFFEPFTVRVEQSK